MDMLNDPEMKEIIDGFCDEAIELFDQLEDALNDFEDNPSDRGKLELFGQIIDRVMGTAQSIGATEIATFCELGKIIGYKSSQTDDAPLLNVVAAILFDAVDMLRKMIQNLQNKDNASLQSLNTQAFVKRLNWLSDKFKDIDRASCSFEDKGVGGDSKDNMSQNSIDDLMATLGL